MFDLQRHPFLPRRGQRLARWLWILVTVALLASCVSVPLEQRALLLRPGEALETQTLTCAGAETLRKAWRPGSEKGALDPKAIRIVTWNIHKEENAGWDEDLAKFVKDNDIVLLQEVTLRDSLRRIVEHENLSWVLASSFRYHTSDVGVLTASRVSPIASCTQRIVEPLIRLPKSAIITWLPLANSTQTLAVVNVHAVNFSLFMKSYQEQFAGLADALANHDGPIIFAGDFNTWREARMQAVYETAKKLGLDEIPYATDERTLFFGRELDHIMVRGLDVIGSTAISVSSSDHNPVAATLRVMAPP